MYATPSFTADVRAELPEIGESCEEWAVEFAERIPCQDRGDGVPCKEDEDRDEVPHCRVTGPHLVERKGYDSCLMMVAERRSSREEDGISLCT